MGIRSNRRPGRSAATGRTTGRATRLAAAGVAGATLLAGIGSIGLAGAAGATTTAPGRATLEQQLAARQAALADLTASANDHALLTASVRQTLLNQLTAQTSGIDALVQAVPTAPTTQLLADEHTMIDQYRVYLMMGPKVHFAERVAQQESVEQKAITREPGVAARITAGQTAGGTTTAAETAYQSLVADVQSAADDTAQVNVTALLALTPAGYPGNGSTITADRASLVEARDEVPHIRADIHSLRVALRALRKQVVTGLRNGRRSGGAATGTTAPTTPITVAPAPSSSTSPSVTTTATVTPTGATGLTGTLATLGTFTGTGTATTSPGHSG